MKFIQFKLALILTFLSSTLLANSGLSTNLSKASKHSVLAASHGIKASGQVASGVVAVPLIISGQLGTVALDAGESLMKNATGSEELIISEITITADPTPQVIMDKKDTGE